jgi:long-subunit acyl-CoA synthetase (AMP-forming)
VNLTRGKLNHSSSSALIIAVFQDGELCVAGPQVMKGYYRNEKATKKTVINGWLHTGDIARYTEDKQFFIVDRLKELIKVKGLQVRYSFFMIMPKNFRSNFRMKNHTVLKGFL